MELNFKGMGIHHWIQNRKVTNKGDGGKKNENNKTSGIHQRDLMQRIRSVEGIWRGGRKEGGSRERESDEDKRISKLMEGAWGGSFQAKWIANEYCIPPTCSTSSAP